MTAVRGVLLTIVVLAGCLVAAVAVANVVDMFAPGTFLHGRNMTRVALLASVLIFVAALLRRHAVHWRQVLIELAVIELVTTGLIWFWPLLDPTNGTIEAHDPGEHLGLGLRSEVLGLQRGPLRVQQGQKVGHALAIADACDRRRPGPLSH